MPRSLAALTPRPEQPPRDKAPEQLLWLTGRRIRYVRELWAMSGMEVAERAGIPGSALSAIENGRRNPTLMTLGRIATALRCSVRDLMPSPGTVPEAPLEDGGPITP
jgi:transcriptional regulator with XRE-family HTH domain